MIEAGCKTRENTSARSPRLDRQDDGVQSVLRGLKRCRWSGKQHDRQVQAKPFEAPEQR